MLPPDCSGCCRVNLLQAHVGGRGVFLARGVMYIQHIPPLTDLIYSGKQSFRNILQNNKQFEWHLGACVYVCKCWR